MLVKSYGHVIFTETIYKYLSPVETKITGLIRQLKLSCCSSLVLYNSCSNGNVFSIAHIGRRSIFRYLSRRGSRMERPILRRRRHGNGADSGDTRPRGRCAIIPVCCALIFHIRQAISQLTRGGP